VLAPSSGRRKRDECGAVRVINVAASVGFFGGRKGGWVGGVGGRKTAPLAETSVGEGARKRREKQKRVSSFM